MTVSDRQLEDFTGQPNPSLIVANFMSKFNPIFAKGPKEQDGLDKNNWDKTRTDIAEATMQKAVGVGELHPPSEIEQQNRLNVWWKRDGQFLPRHVLDTIGIVGGEKLPSIQESMELDSKQRLSTVKDFLGIEVDKGGDPLADLIVFDPIADPSDIGFEPEPELKDIIEATNVEDLKIIRDTMQSNPFDPDFSEGLSAAISDEIAIKETIPKIIDKTGDAPITALLGTDLFNTFFFNIPEFASRKGLSPTENLLGLPKGSESIAIRAASRVRGMLAAKDPSLLKTIGLETGGIIATVAQFALLPDASKIAAFSQLSGPVKAAIGVGTKAGLIELLKAPAVDEDVLGRLEKVAIATGIGALTGAALSKIITTIKDVPVHLQAIKIRQKFPEFSQAEVVEIIKIIKEGRLIDIRLTRIPPAKRITAPKGFRVGAAEIEKPVKAAAVVAKKVARGKEATAIEAARAVFAAKTQPSKTVKPTKVITKVEAAGLKEIGAIGEGEKLRIVANPQLKRSIQADEKVIAQLKTRRNELLAERQFVVANTKALEIKKKEIALASL